MKVKIGHKLAVLVSVALLLEINPCEAAKVQQLCVDPDNSSCSATIQDAVDQASGDAVITVAAGTFTGNVSINPQSPKSKKLTLAIGGAGPGSTVVDGGDAGQVFSVGPKTTLTLSGMTIQHGKAITNGGGGVYSLNSTITIDNCLITENTAYIGGGIRISGGSLTLKNSTVSDNTTSPNPNVSVLAVTDDGGGLFVDSGGKLAIADSTITGNTADEGGGILLVGTGTIQGSTISDNTAAPIVPAGGGFFVSAEGAGIAVTDIGSSLTILNSTISGNVAQAADSLSSLGGGILNVSAAVTLNNVTIADNQASGGGGVRTTHGRRFTTSNSIIADNGSDDCEGTLDSLGFNLILDASGCSVTGNKATDIIGEDPMLQSLASNPPGTTETQALSEGSPALKAGNPAKPNGKSGHCLPTDQRGVTRPTKACDIGAFQLSD
jgi:hypothetical protein